MRKGQSKPKGKGKEPRVILPTIKERSMSRASGARESRASQLIRSASLPNRSRTNKKRQSRTNKKRQSKRQSQSFRKKKSWKRSTLKAESIAPKTHKAKAPLRTRQRLLNTP
jgi:hypothetical protein